MLLKEIEVSRNLGKYMLADVVTWIAGYERYFEITEEEYYMFGSDELDAIAESVHKEGTASQRFFYSKNI